MHEKADDIDLNLLEEMGYEHRDVNVSSINKSLVIFFIASAILMFVGMGVMLLIAPKQLTTINRTDVATPRKRMPDPGIPLIQSNATALPDMREFSAKESESLSSYHWTDRKNGFASIPVEDALKKVAKSGLPQRANKASVEAPK